MRVILLASFFAAMIGSAGNVAQACNGRLGLGSRCGGLGPMSAAVVALTQAQMQMAAQQYRYEMARKQESHRQHVATYSQRRDRLLAEREQRREARLANSRPHDTPGTQAHSLARAE